MTAILASSCIAVPTLDALDSSAEFSEGADLLTLRTNVMLGAFLTILIFLLPYPLTALRSAKEARFVSPFLRE